MRKVGLGFLVCFVFYLAVYFYFELQVEASKTDPWPKEAIDSEVKGCTEKFKEINKKDPGNFDLKLVEPFCRCAGQILVESDDIPFESNPLNFTGRSQEFETIKKLVISDGKKCADLLLPRVAR